MIYNLNEKFTKVNEKKGVLENKSSCSTVELVVSEDLPEKDTGIELQAKEKMVFSLEEGKSLYARCTNLSGVMANLGVVNFNLPASSYDGVGECAGSLKQITKLGAIGTTLVEIPVNITKSYKFPSVEILKFASGREHKQKIEVFNFSPENGAKFTVDGVSAEKNSQVVFDGTVHLNTAYDYQMVKSTTFNGMGQYAEDSNIDDTIFKVIEEGEVE